MEISKASCLKFGMFTPLFSIYLVLKLHVHQCKSRRTQKDAAILIFQHKSTGDLQLSSDLGHKSNLMAHKSHQTKSKSIWQTLVGLNIRLENSCSTRNDC